MNYECKFWPLVLLNEKQNTAVTNDLCRDEWYFGHDIMQTGKRNLKSLNSHKTGVSFVAKVELLETAELQVMASTSSYKGVHAFAALILIFALCATFLVLKQKLADSQALEYHDTAQAEREIDQSYILMIADSEQNFAVENALTDNKVNLSQKLI